MKFNQVNTCIIRHCLMVISLPLGFLSLRGQFDTIQHLEPVEVTAFRIDLTDIGKHSDPLDTGDMAELRSSTLASMLRDQTPLYVRSYGVGTLATLGIRGGSASHTQIVWNGIPIRNPMIGMVDLNLIPAALIDDAAVHYGGHGAAFGSGAVGGLLSVSNQKLTDQNGLQLQLSTGSWSARYAEVKLDYGFSKFRFSTRAFSRFAENDYNYIPLKGLAEKRQVHQRLKDNGLLQEVLFKINKQQSITGRAWYQSTNRQIPPTAVQNVSRSAQQDKNFRSSIEWTYVGSLWRWQVKTAWLDENINFQDSSILLYTHNHFNTWLGEAQVSCKAIQRLDLTGGLYGESVSAMSDNYLGSENRTQYAVFTSARWLLEKWMFRFQLREELTAQAWSPLLYDLSTEWSIFNSLTLKASISKNYRTPTLNDLHWRPGGNPDLIPESGWTIEGGFQLKTQADKIRFTTSLTGYSRKIDQWIMWMPPVKDVSLYWAPINVAQVNSYGMEWREEVTLNMFKGNVSLRSGLDLTWSTFGTDIPDFQIREGDQLFYVPVENVSSQLSFTKPTWSAYYAHHWFGSSPGINEDVKGANVGSAGFSFGFKGSRFKTTILLQIDNVWNVPYRIIERRPMPGRSYELGLKLTI